MFLSSSQSHYGSQLLNKQPYMPILSAKKNGANSSHKITVHGKNLTCSHTIKCFINKGKMDKIVIYHII
uniref:Uncharacterized protein n=1 Tax=Timema cristinae TaxID=61476 RepID=A0A7R9CYU6_TIMCR|nr:unnamed protein product [Timema cristinae]